MKFISSAEPVPNTEVTKPEAKTDVSDDEQMFMDRMERMVKLAGPDHPSIRNSVTVLLPMRTKKVKVTQAEGNNMKVDNEGTPQFGLYEAIKLAKQAHVNQVDKVGKPYIYHPLMVMAMLDTELEMIVGVLHDVVEDTSVTLDNLREAGASEVVVDAVDAITKRPGEQLEDYWQRVKANPIARRAKLMDATHNGDPLRLAQIESEEKRERFRTKYGKIVQLMAE